MPDSDWLATLGDPTQQDILRAQIQALRTRNNPQDIAQQSRAAALLGAFHDPGMQNMGRILGGEAAAREAETQPRLMGAMKSVQEAATQKQLGGVTPTAFELLTKREQVPKFATAFPGSQIFNVHTGQVTGGVGGAGGDPVSQIGDAIIEGKQAPDLKGLGPRMQGPVRSYLANKGFDQAKALNEWTATQHHISTLNGQQQERLRQAVEFTTHSLDNIEQLYNQWKQVGATSGVRIFNRASLAASKQLPGPAGATAQALEAAIADSVAEMANVYMGGNSPTDQAIKLASHNLAADWNEETFVKALQLARNNLRLRKNAMMGSATAGVGPSGSRYEAPPQAPVQAPGAPQQAAPAGPRPRRTANGETREWDGKAWVPVGR